MEKKKWVRKCRKTHKDPKQSIFTRHSVPGESWFHRNLEDHTQSSVCLHDLGCQLRKNRTQDLLALKLKWNLLALKMSETGPAGDLYLYVGITADAD